MNKNTHETEAIKIVKQLIEDLKSDKPTSSYYLQAYKKLLDLIKDKP